MSIGFFSSVGDSLTSMSTKKQTKITMGIFKNRAKIIEPKFPPISVHHFAFTLSNSEQN